MQLLGSVLPRGCSSETRAIRLPGPSTLREAIDLLASNSEAFVIAGGKA
jgi:hypothetical protein